MDFILPNIGEGVYEAEMVRWLVASGTAVRPGDALLELLTDKATMEIPAPFAGTIDSLAVEAGDRLKIGQVILTYKPAKQEAATPGIAKEAKDGANPSSRSLNGSSQPSGSGIQPTPLAVKASPSVRQMARKLGVDLSIVHGTGPEGRVLLDDLKLQRPPLREVAEERPVPVLTGPTASGRDTPPPLFAPSERTEYGRPGTRIKLAGIRRQIAEHMVHSKTVIPHYSYVDECDVTDLVKLRTSLKSVYERLGVKLTYLAFFVKAVAAALMEVPIVNSTLEDDKGEIVLHDRYDIGVAVATPSGLLVPVIREAHKKDLGTVARELERLSSDARSGKSRREDLRGGTFTITSVGNLGGLISTPVINHPEVGIMGVGKVVRRPVYDDYGDIRPADLVYLSFSFDHRVVDGAVGAVFGNAVLSRLRNPAAMLVQ